MPQRPTARQRTVISKRLSPLVIGLVMIMSILGCTVWTEWVDSSEFDVRPIDVTPTQTTITPTFGPTPTPDPYRTATPTSTPEPEASLLNDKFLIDETLFSANENCSLPCWRSIRLGVTEWDKAVTILQGQTDLTNIKFKNNDVTGELAVTFQRVGGVPCCLLYSKGDEVVEQILLQLSPIHTLGSVIEAIGEPIYFNGTVVDEDQAAAALFYTTQNTVIYAFIDGEAGDLMAESEISAVLILSPSDMQQVLDTSALQAYDGFKAFRDYMDDEWVLTPVPTNN